MNTGNNHTEQSNCSFTILYAIECTIRYNIIIWCYLAGPSFAKQSLVQIIYKYKMHHRWVCAKGRGDYLQQVHLRIIHSSKHCLASDKQACEQCKWWLTLTVQAVWADDGAKWVCWPGSLWNWVFVLFAYSAFSLPPSTGFTGSGSSSRACCRSLSFTSCTPQ